MTADTPPLGCPCDSHSQPPVLRVVEFFLSIQGESTRQGQPCGFIRLAGCDLSCSYCDTPHAHSADSGREVSIDVAARHLLHFNVPLLEITGGEPLLQKPAVAALAGRLLDAGRTVMLETNGANSIAGLDPRLEIMLDVKTPGSGMADHMLKNNLPLMQHHDELKFILTGRDDYSWACNYLRHHSTSHLRAVHFSPVTSLLSPAELAGWMHRQPPPGNAQIGRASCRERV